MTQDKYRQLSEALMGRKKVVQMPGKTSGVEKILSWVVIGVVAWTLLGAFVLVAVRMLVSEP